MAAGVSIPCIKLPSATPLKITLPFGVELKAMADLSQGPPTDCALIHSLMLQLMPALAGMACLLKLINVVKSSMDLLNSKTPPDLFSNLAKTAQVVQEFLTSCLPTPLQICTAAKDILLLIIAFLECFIDSVESVLKFQVGIDLNSASGNPVLLASLSCAQDNAQASLDQLMQAMAVLQPILSAIKPLTDALPVSITLPSLSNLAGAKDLTQALDQLHSTLEQLKQVVEAIPC
jgi:hypothetical protein